MFGPHTFTHGLPLEQEFAAVAFRADMREAEEVESFRRSYFCVGPARFRISAERDQTGFSGYRSAEDYAHVLDRREIRWRGVRLCRWTDWGLELTPSFGLPESGSHDNAMIPQHRVQTPGR
jgi:hypothetical protein